MFSLNKIPKNSLLTEYLRILACINVLVTRDFVLETRISFLNLRIRNFAV